MNPTGDTISPALRSYHKRAQENLARGLTTRGKRRKRRPNFLTAEDRLKARRARGLRHWEQLATKRRLAGFTTRGKEPVPAYRERRMEVLILATEIDAASAALAAVFHDLPGTAQARCLELANHLGAIKRRIA